MTPYRRRSIVKVLKGRTIIDVKIVTGPDYLLLTLNDGSVVSLQPGFDANGMYWKEFA